MIFFKQFMVLALGKKEEFNFVDRLVLSSILFLCIVSFTGIFINILISLGVLPISLAIFTFFIYVYIYIIARFYDKIYRAKIIFSILSFFLSNLFWFGNYGSRGPSIYIFLPYIAIMVFIWNDTQIKIISLAIIINIFILFIIEFKFPEISDHYPNEKSRIIDCYSGLLMFMGVLVIMVIYAKNNYVYEYERAKRSDKLKSAFLANMSHEIRTPLNAILGFTNLLTSRELTKEKKDLYAKLILENGDFLLKLISDILDVSIIESGQMKTTIQNVDLNALCNRVYNTNNNILNQKGLKEVAMRLKIPEIPVFIRTDELRIEQVLTNLVNNSLKFTSQGFIQMGYRIQKNSILFFVEDSGIGIKNDLQPGIFNRFAKNEDIINNNFVRGTGIGLALSKELITILGGNIWFTSEYLKGSEFYFTLPSIKN